MPVYIVVTRIAQCAVCRNQWDLKAGEDYPETCLHCGSRDWMWGPEPQQSSEIRQGISRLRRRLNPGATSKKRQDHGRKQWTKFLSKEEYEERVKEKEDERAKQEEESRPAESVDG